MTDQQIKNIYRGHYQLYRDMIEGKITPSEYREKEKYFIKKKEEIQKSRN